MLVAISCGAAWCIAAMRCCRRLRFACTPVRRRSSSSHAIWPSAGSPCIRSARLTVPCSKRCDRSITELQLDTALRDARDGTLARMVWVPPRIEMVDQRQQQLLVRVRTELPSKGFEILEGPLTEIGDAHHRSAGASGGRR